MLNEPSRSGCATMASGWLEATGLRNDCDSFTNSYRLDLPPTQDASPHRDDIALFK